MNTKETSTFLNCSMSVYIFSNASLFLCDKYTMLRLFVALLKAFWDKTHLRSAQPHDGADCRESIDGFFNPCDMIIAMLRFAPMNDFCGRLLLYSVIYEILFPYIRKM